VLTVTVGIPQASVAVALPNAASIAADVGLHPSGASLPVAVIVGAVTSAVHVAVRDVVAVLLQASVAVKVLVCEREHPLD
jgi:membrane-bound lytic murein transglycosylase